MDWLPEGIFFSVRELWVCVCVIFSISLCRRCVLNHSALISFVLTPSLLVTPSLCMFLLSPKPPHTEREGRKRGFVNSSYPPWARRKKDLQILELMLGVIQPTSICTMRHADKFLITIQLKTNFWFLWLFPSQIILHLISRSVSPHPLHPPTRTHTLYPLKAATWPHYHLKIAPTTPKK